MHDPTGAGMMAARLFWSWLVALSPLVACHGGETAKGKEYTLEEGKCAAVFPAEPTLNVAKIKGNDDKDLEGKSLIANHDRHRFFLSVQPSKAELLSTESKVYSALLGFREGFLQSGAKLQSEKRM